MSYWCQELLEAVSRRGAGGYPVVFPSYRPDLVEDLALTLGCVFADFRRERLAPMGPDAHRLALEAIEDFARIRTNERGVVLHNAEALLATKTEDERRKWLERFVAHERDRVVILPLALFGSEAPGHPAVLRLTPDQLPQESLLRQLASMRIQ